MHAMKELIHSKVQAARAGVNGEVRVDDVFQKYSFPFEYVVLHDVSLESRGKFQMDTICLTQYFAVILESKNIGGSLSFKDNPLQLVRELDDGKMDAFESPEVQIERNKYLLSDWFRSIGVELPIYGVIVLSNPKTIVVNSPHKFPIIFPQTIPVFLRNIPRAKVYMDVHQMHNLAKEIVASHRSYIPYPMCKRWSIDPRDLLTGVLCEKCDKLVMVKRKNGWNCLNCGHVDRHAHEKAIREWFVLIGESINNRQCRYFLQLDSFQSASRILNSMGLVREGTSKSNTIYKWIWDEKS
ncbi:nuclease-related domain-containing protein [Psychrobacillus sp. NPDC096426]|uniref:nuclease-related domain-containing protein n=1 Tax=Psychrobacillus sp. NPDC096426 TaxID=3364491 RepID=UPI00383085CE